MRKIFGVYTRTSVRDFDDEAIGPIAAAGVGDFIDKRLLRRFAPRNDTRRSARNDTGVDSQSAAIGHGFNGI